MGASASKAKLATPLPDEAVRAPQDAADLLRRVTFVEQCLASSLTGDAATHVAAASAPWTNHQVLYAETDVGCAAADVAHVLHDLKRMPEYDPDLREAAVADPAHGASLPRGTTAVHIALKPINGAIGARAFGTIHAAAYNVATAANGDTRRYEYVSAFTDAGRAVATAPGHVRGTCHAYGFTVRELPGGTPRSRVGCVMCFDLGGWLPNSLADKGGPAMQHLLANLVKVCEAGDRP
uniref:START domain-containing protein n=1 Tax=Neobodo designis TaxID=312471 RepID=A0A7S1QP16_NEODS|mmetsp:Transcript_49602/g.153158  ORF Transcript_49602/g.153158 Transcript_49602/m.153158 type:complete len:237 (+) Transcript_49602:38-748(+)|eukprot:CAMPEP_0174852592 /NCGR_PEP_ID=MMETSP1114-20130205/26005_1 /TAXON_ID=312471 /ORGANISM="Neobodo designis, Strain CCAP 1951/1" /LENGTH=236 /DNA_ID=CAMNT_0016087199 /DNA_START=36 /DNA_END=746 /DNA_ORIENTATION=+